ncbi:cytochrome P450 716B1-like isoform X3 [Euphorbia lathyris]
MKQNTAEAWLMERSRKYGPVSKMHIFGAPTVFLHGQGASKFMYTSDVLSSQNPSSSLRIYGKRYLFELSGNEHKRIRGALVSFLKPDVLKQSVGKMDEEIRSQIRMQWHGKQKISVMPFMKTLSFNIMSSFIVGIEQGSRRERLKQLFYRIVEGALTVPINFPFTSFSRSIKARAKIRAITLELIHEKRAALEQLQASPQKDLLTCLIALRNEDNSPMLSDEEIVDNAIFTMVAGHDTTSVLLTFLIKLLASDASIHASIVQEQEEIAKSKAPGELLTWDDLLRMKYTWSVAMETLRMYPPSFFTFRKAVKDFEYEGFHIPKGWQVMGASFTTHMNDSIFPNASEFDPARFEKQQLSLAAMDPLIFIIFLFLLILPLYFLLTKKSSKRVPPGSLGLPIIGQSLSLLRAMKQNTAEAWLIERIRKYGPVSKMNVFGTPSVFLHGQAANKFMYTSHDSFLSNQQPSSIRRILGERNIFELTGHDHKRVRGALVSFLKPEVLKQYVGRMDEDIRSEISKHWQDKQKISVMPFIKTLTFNIMSSLIMGIEQGSRRDRLKQHFHHILDGLLSVPINLPFTNFNRSLKARVEIRDLLMELVHEKRAALDQQKASPQQDLLTCLINLRNDDNSAMFSDEEIVDNAVLTIFAGYDTNSILLTFLIRLLASDASIHANILQEQEEIAKSKALGELLTWDDLIRMKYTWSVAMETLRMYPPGLLHIRKVMKDIEYEGFLIPKGWQLTVAPFMTHMDDSIFPNASEFDPAHFQKQASIPPYSFTTFGGGPRICPGNEFAKIETLVTIHYLVTRFSWKLSSPDVSFSRDPFPSFKNGLEILIQPKITTKLN